MQRAKDGAASRSSQRRMTSWQACETGQSEDQGRPALAQTRRAQEAAELAIASSCEPTGREGTPMSKRRTRSWSRLARQACHRSSVRAKCTGMRGLIRVQRSQTGQAGSPQVLIKAVDRLEETNQAGLFTILHVGSKRVQADKPANPHGCSRQAGFNYANSQLADVLGSGLGFGCGLAEPSSTDAWAAVHFGGGCGARRLRK